MSTSSLRQHQRKSAVATGGHSPLARNHSAGASTHRHSSAIFLATQTSTKSLPLPSMTTTTTATATAKSLQRNDNSKLNDKTSSNIFNFEHQINHFHNSSINQNVSETNMLRSTRHLCGSIIPLQSSTPSPNIDHLSIENEQSSSSTFSPLPFQKLDLKYRFYFLILNLNFYKTQ
jgi:hypothetical protein